MATYTKEILANGNDPLLQKCTFIMNALENGWKVKKRDGSYIFSKKHRGQKEYFRKGYLDTFLTDNMKSL